MATTENTTTYLSPFDALKTIDPAVMSARLLGMAFEEADEECSKRAKAIRNHLGLANTPEREALRSALAEALVWKCALVAENDYRTGEAEFG
jgi:hypothetical protein